MACTRGRLRLKASFAGIATQAAIGRVEEEETHLSAQHPVIGFHVRIPIPSTWYPDHVSVARELSEDILKCLAR